MIGNLWVEKWRPKTLDSYVFKDENLKFQIESWIKEGSIPNILMSGGAGMGKCLCGDELVDIQIDTSTLSDEKIKKLEKYKL